MTFPGGLLDDRIFGSGYGSYGPRKPTSPFEQRSGSVYTKPLAPVKITAKRPTLGEIKSGSVDSARAQLGLAGVTAQQTADEIRKTAQRALVASALARTLTKGAAMGDIFMGSAMGAATDPQVIGQAVGETASHYQSLTGEELTPGETFGAMIPGALAGGVASAMTGSRLFTGGLAMAGRAMAGKRAASAITPLFAGAGAAATTRVGQLGERIAGAGESFAAMRGSAKLGTRAIGELAPMVPVNLAQGAADDEGGETLAMGAQAIGLDGVAAALRARRGGALGMVENELFDVAGFGALSGVAAASRATKVAGREVVGAAAGGAVGYATGDGDVRNDQLTRTLKGMAMGAVGARVMRDGQPGLSTKIVDDVPSDAVEAAFPMYSRVLRSMARDAKGTGDAGHWRGIIKSTPQAERDLTGVDAWLAAPEQQGRKIARDEIMRVHAEKLPKFGEQVLGHNVNEKASVAAEAHRVMSEKYDNLGFDSPGEALREVRTNPNWRSDFDMSDATAEHIDLFESYARLPASERSAQLDRYRDAERTKYEGYLTPGAHEDYSEIVTTLDKGKGKSLATGQVVTGHDGRAWTITGRNEMGMIQLRSSDTGEVAPPIAETQLRLWMNNGETPEAPYRSSHWDVDNPITHTRVDVREIDGKRALYVEDSQSDWHQQGKAKGYKGNPDVSGWTAKPGDGDPASGPTWEVRDANGRWVVGIPRENGTTAEQAIRRAADSERGPDSARVPDAPLKKTPQWTELNLKRILHEAVKRGVDTVVLPTGAQAADQFDLRKSVDKLTYNPKSQEFSAWKEGRIVHTGTYDAKALPDVVGKEAADKLLASPLPTADDLAGMNERLRGIIARKKEIEVEGMRAFNRNEDARYREIKAEHAALEREQGMLTSRMLDIGAGGGHELAGDDLAVGGVGMSAYYDKIVPGVVKDLAKKLGVTIEMGPAAKGPTTDATLEARLTAASELDRDLGRQAADARAERRQAIEEFGLNSDEHAAANRRLRDIDAERDRVQDEWTALNDQMNAVKKDNTFAKNLAITLTPELREAVKAGQPLFAAGALSLTGDQTDDERRLGLLAGLAGVAIGTSPKLFKYAAARLARLTVPEAVIARAATTAAAHTDPMVVRRTEAAAWKQQLVARQGAPFNAAVRAQAEAYAKASGVASQQLPPITEIDEAFARRIAAWYEKTPSTPNDPATIAAYRAFAKETAAQYEALVQQGVKFEFMTDDPYASSAEVLRDIAENNRLRVFDSGDDFGHPLLSREENNQFRAVHDWYGHGKEGYQFGPVGEDNAYRAHAAMYSSEARSVMAVETRGQNSWVNYGRFGEQNRTNPATTIYADQKVMRMPPEFSGDASAYPKPAATAALHARFVAARNASKRAAYMAPLEPGELAGKRIMLTHGDRVGYALDAKGDLQSLFNAGGPPGAGTDAILHALANGAATLDAFDGFLPKLYARFGFVETGRMRFDPAQAPPGWDYEAGGTPDVVFMAWQGLPAPVDEIRRATIAKEFTPHVRSDRYFTDYDAAKQAARDAHALRAGDARRTLPPAPGVDGAAAVRRPAANPERRGAVSPTLAGGLSGAGGGMLAGTVAGIAADRAIGNDADTRQGALLGALAGFVAGGSAGALVMRRLPGLLGGTRAATLTSTDPAAAVLFATIASGARVQAPANSYLSIGRRAYARVVDGAYALRQFGREFNGEAPLTGLDAQLRQSQRWVTWSDQFARTHVTPLLRAVRGIEGDVMTYAKAQRLLDLDARGDTSWKQGNVTPDQARQVLAGYAGNARVTEGAAELQRVYRQLLDLKLDEGLITPERYGEIIASEDFYTPFVREWEREGVRGVGLGNVPQSGKVMNRSGGVRKLDREQTARANTTDPFEQLVLDTQHTWRLVAKQRIAQQVGAIVEAHGGEIPGVIKRVSKSANPDPLGRRIDAIVSGEQFTYEILDDELHKALLSFGPKTQVPALLRMVKEFKRATITTLPDFAFRNLLRDNAQVALQNPVSWRSVGGGMAIGAAANGGRAMTDEDASMERTAFAMLAGVGYGAGGAILGTQLFRTMRGVSDIMSASDSPVTALIGRSVGGNAQAWADFLADGGASLGHYAKSTADARQYIQQLRGDRAPAGAFLNPRRWWEAMNALGSTLENAPRLDTYKQSLIRNPGERALAAARAADVSLDFSRAGGAPAQQMLNETNAFFNARIQGWDKVARMAADPRTYAVGFAALTAPSIGNWIAVHQDEESRVSYYEHPAYVRNLFWLVPTGGGEFLYIPKPFELGTVFATIPERALDHWYTQAHRGDAKPGESAASTAKELAMQVLATEIPMTDALKPIVEQGLNLDMFRDRPIVTSEQFQKTLPEQQYDDRTTKVARILGETYGMSPQRIDHLLRSYAGSVGQVAVRTIDMALPGTASTSPAAGRVPIVGDLIAGFTDRRGQTSDDEIAVRRRYNEIQRVENALKPWKKAYEGATTDAERQAALHQIRVIAERHAGEIGPNGEHLDGLKLATDQLTELRDEAKAIQKNPKLSPEAKAEALATNAKVRAAVARLAVSGQYTVLAGTP